MDKKGKNVLIQAVQSGNQDEVYNQIQMGADPTYSDWTSTDAIIYAMKLNELEIFSLMLNLCKDSIDLNHKFFSQK